MRGVVIPDYCPQDRRLGLGVGALRLGCTPALLPRGGPAPAPRRLHVQESSQHSATIHSRTSRPERVFPAGKGILVFNVGTCKTATGTEEVKDNSRGSPVHKNKPHLLKAEAFKLCICFPGEGEERTDPMVFFHCCPSRTSSVTSSESIGPVPWGHAQAPQAKQEARGGCNRPPDCRQPPRAPTAHRPAPCGGGFGGDHCTVLWCC